MVVFENPVVLAKSACVRPFIVRQYAILAPTWRNTIFLSTLTDLHPVHCLYNKFYHKWYLCKVFYNAIIDIYNAILCNI